MDPREHTRDASRKHVGCLVSGASRAMNLYGGARGRRGGALVSLNSIKEREGARTMRSAVVKEAFAAYLEAFHRMVHCQAIAAHVLLRPLVWVGTLLR